MLTKIIGNWDAVCLLGISFLQTQLFFAANCEHYLCKNSKYWDLCTQSLEPQKWHVTAQNENIEECLARWKKEMTQCRG